MPKIYAHFDRMLEARQAIKELNNMGFKRAYLDVADRFSEEQSADITPSLNENFSVISEAFLRPDRKNYTFGKGNLIASDPVFGGIGSSKVQLDVNTRLAVNVEDEKAEEVKDLLKKLGGRL